jgi:hypothetical protein
MKRFSIVILLTAWLGTFIVSSLAADDTLARFRGGIGVHPVSNVGTNADGSFASVTRNIVRAVNPAGQLWVISDLDARVSRSGDIKVQGKGLVLAGGNSAGRATGQKVFATLICESAAPFSEHSTDTAGVPLSANGDFKIDDVLTTVPADCADPMLLIRNAVKQTAPHSRKP